MASIGRFAFAGVSTAVEVTNALASVNIDFSLVKIDPPHEFRDVGEILAPKRRNTAEDGPLHITARRLGAIFEAILPQTPQLIKSYGHRASEIARASAKASPASKGIFSQQAGIDAASIWAGATSGSGAIQVHLLACMLARMWTGPEATSIWVELLNCRRMRLEEEFRKTGTMDMRTMVAVKQQIDRAQLAEWDASARAWLRIADIAKNLQHKQLLLILGNLDKVVNSKPVLYDSVIKAWTTGMEGMEALLQGSPMMMQTGDMPLALSSWHIYPDLNIVSTTTKLVRQKDSLVPASGILTIGLERHDSNSSKGLQWSLPLAHLRFYGNPVKRVSELTIQGARLSLLDFDMAVLGCVLGGWGDPDSDLDAIRWMSKISDLMVSTYPDESHRLDNTWLRILGKTASAFLESTDTERQRFTKLLYLGRGRRSFIADRSPPFFGLTSIDLLMRMVRTSEQRVKILRAHMQRAGIPFEHAIIRYVPKTTGREEFASAAPRHRPTPKRTSPGSDSSRSKSSVGHIRWVHQTSAQLISPNEDLVERPHAGADVYPDIDADETNKEMERQAVADKRASHITLENEAEHAFRQAKDKYEAVGEEVLSVEEEHIKTISNPGRRLMRVRWGMTQVGPGLEEYDHWIGPMKHYEQWFGDVQTAAVFLRLDQDPAVPGGEIRVPFRELASLFDQDAIDPEAFISELLRGNAPGKAYSDSLRAYSTMHSLYRTLNQVTIDVRVLQRPLAGSKWVESLFTLSDSLLPAASSMEGDREYIQNSPGNVSGDEASSGGESEPEDEALQAGSFQDIMEMLNVDVPETPSTPGPVVQVKTAAVKDLLRVTGPIEMTLEQSFSCILMFESSFDVPPHQAASVMAISSGNSLFIASSLLSDPHSLPTRRKISHVMGNIGHPGTVLLVPPVQPRMTVPGIERWPLMTFRDWDGTGSDSFAESSLHLWFTGSTQEVSIGYSGAQDKELYMIESVVSLHGKGEWVADLDILRALQSPSLIHLQRKSIPPSVKGQVVLREGFTEKRSETGCEESHVSQYNHQKLPLTAIETWWELLEKSSKDCVFLAAGNWQARLAAMMICIAQGRKVSIISNPVCWDCVADAKKTLSQQDDPVVYIY